MRTGALIVAGAVAALVVGGCRGGDEGSPVTVPSSNTTNVSGTALAAPSPSTTTPVTNVTAPPTTTSTTAIGAPVSNGILRPDGIGPVDFGAPADQAVAALRSLLGPPDGREEGQPGDECVEGSSWRECALSISGATVVSWSRLGLEIALGDDLGSWHAIRPGGGETLATVEGLEPGMTVADLRRIYPEAMTPCCGEGGRVDSFVVPLPAGSMSGSLEWSSEADYVMAVQRSLNGSGADLVVDGVIGPKTRQAWDDFCRTRDLGCESQLAGLGLSDEVIQALGFPPADTRLLDLQAGQG